MVSAFVFVEVGDVEGAADMEALHNALHAVAGVKSVHFVAGPTDIIVFVNASDQPALMESVAQIRAVKGVTSTDTRIVFPM